MRPKSTRQAERQSFYGSHLPHVFQHCIIQVSILTPFIDDQPRSRQSGEGVSLHAGLLAW